MALVQNNGLYYSAQNQASVPSLIIQRSFQEPEDDFLPLYDRRPRNQHIKCTLASQNPPPAYEDSGFMRTVDRRYRDIEAVDEPPKYYRSSFALSDIFELDEDEVEIEILQVVPTGSLPSSSSSPTESTSSSFTLLSATAGPGKRLLRRAASFASTTSSSKTKKVKTLVKRFLTKLPWAGPRIVENSGTKTGLDLLEC